MNSSERGQKRSEWWCEWILILSGAMGILFVLKVKLCNGPIWLIKGAVKR